MDDDRTYRLTRRRNPTTRINLRDVVVARDDRRTERDIPLVQPPTTGPLAAPPTPGPTPAPTPASEPAAPALAGGSSRELPRLNRSTLPLPSMTRAPGSGTFPSPSPLVPAAAAPTSAAPSPSLVAAAPSTTTAPALAPRPAGFPPRRHAQGTASTIERRSFGDVEILIEHRGDEVTLIIPGAAPLVGTRTQVIALIAGLLGRT